MQYSVIAIPEDIDIPSPLFARGDIVKSELRDSLDSISEQRAEKSLVVEEDHKLGAYASC